MNKENNDRYPACVQVWDGGSSAVYYSGMNNYSKDMSDYEYFKKQHEDYRANGNTTASLLEFNSHEELDNWLADQLDYDDVKLSSWEVDNC